MEIGKYENREIWKYGNLEIWKYETLDTLVWTWEGLMEIWKNR